MSTNEAPTKYWLPIQICYELNKVFVECIEAWYQAWHRCCPPAAAGMTFPPQDAEDEEPSTKC